MTDHKTIAADPRVELSTLQLFLTHWRGSLFGAAVAAVITVIIWHDYLSWSQRTAWMSVVMMALAVEAFVCVRLERATILEEDVTQWMPGLYISIFIAGSAWGMVPWMLANASVSTQLLAVFFNLALLFSLTNAPGTKAMLLSAWTSISLPTCSALLSHPELWLTNIALLMVSVAILLYGLRLQRAIGTSIWERYRAADLTEELKQQQQRLIEVERERALLLERERLMHDMHDGLGSVLVSSLAAVERGALTPEGMAEALRECVADLRIVIDSIDPDNNDLVSLLATLRFHLERRLEMAGIQLDWRVDETPPLQWVGASESLQLMRAIQEILTNIIKHARAQLVSVTARESGAGVEVIIRDNGCGFDPDHSTAGRGLRSLRKRANVLHGQLTVNSEPGAGSEVRLWLPFEVSVQSETNNNVARAYHMQI